MPCSPLAILLLLAACDPDGGAKARPDGGDSGPGGSGTDTACEPSPEVCNGADDDCDGEVDEEPADGVSVWPDADGDGYGADTGAARTVCEPAAGEALATGDCDDDDADVNPAASETCNNGKDDDCDETANGCTLEGEVEAEWAPIEIVQEAGDSVGTALYSGDIDGDGTGDLIVVGVLGARGGWGAYFFQGPIEHSLSTSEAFGDVAHDPTYTRFSGLQVFHDLDGDGRADLGLAGYTPEDDWGGGGGGYYSLYRGAPKSLSLDDAVEVAWGSLPAFSLQADVDRVALVSLCGSPEDEVVWCGLFDPFENPDNTMADFGLSDPEYSTYSQAIGDLDGDGLDEAILGDSRGLNVFWGPVAEGSDPGMRCESSMEEFSGFGFSGDLDGDGYADLIAGAPISEKIYLLTNVSYTSDCDLSDAVATLSRREPSSSYTFGRTVSIVGDLDADGADDWVHTLPYSRGGAEALLYLKLPPGTHDDVEASTTNVYVEGSGAALGDNAANAGRDRLGLGWGEDGVADMVSVFALAEGF